MDEHLWVLIDWAGRAQARDADRDEVLRFPRFGGHPMVDVREVFTWPKRRRRTDRAPGL
jgi:hypothetical protein